MEMVRKERRTLSAVLCLLGAGILVAGVLFNPVRSWAQEGPSLAGLAAQVQELTERVAFIEALWINSEPTILIDGSCVTGSEGGVQDATVLSYKETYDEWPNTDAMSVTGVNYDPQTGIIGIQYRALTMFGRQAAIEFWQGCEFLETTDWWAEDYSDAPFEGYAVQGQE